MSINRGFLPKEHGKLPLREIFKSRIIDPESSMKNVKRKNSLVFNSNSSDDYPSSHASIYEAVRISANSSEDNGPKIELITVPPRRGDSTSRSQENDENFRDRRAEFKIQSDNSGFSYGRGTALETITEQKSFATMRTMTRSRSVEDLSSSSFLRYQDSFSLSNSLRRKKSLSMDDLELINRSYHEACAMIERKTTVLSPTDQIYAQPNNPVKAPLQRPGTPPEILSWTSAQSLATPNQENRERMMTQNWLQRQFGLPSDIQTRNSRSAHGSKSRVPININSAQGDVAPRFKPPRSTYFPLNQHPFFHVSTPNTICNPEISNTTPILNDSGTHVRNSGPGNPKKLQRVRFNPPTAMRESGTASPDVSNMVVGSTVTSFNSSSCKKKPTIPKRGFRSGKNRQVEIQCPHIKSRWENPKTLKSGENISGSNRNHNLSSLSNRRSFFNLHPVRNTPTSQTSISMDSVNRSSNPSWARASSFSSTIPLVTGPPITSDTDNSGTLPLEVGNKICWKCKVEHFFDRVGRLWMRAMRCLCFVCCVFEIDENHNHKTSPHLASTESGLSTPIRTSSNIHPGT